MTQDIHVFVEHLKGEVADVTFELLGKGRELASATGGQLVAVLLGSGTDAMVSDLGAADSVLRCDHAALADFNPEPYLATLAGIVASKQPRAVLLPWTSMGMDLGAALSVRQELPFVAYATDVAVEEGQLVVTSQLYGGKILAESVMEGDGGIVSLLAGASPADAGRKDGAPAVEDVPAPDGIDGAHLTFEAIVEPEAGDVDITQHDALVSVGRGIGSEDNLPAMEALAAPLGGAVSSSRPIVDAKWLPKTRQVGKSGLKVKPKIYLALGISGAPEHVEGMKDAELIIAINTDETAPIFEFAHYGTTEDLFDVVPALTEKLK